MSLHCFFHSRLFSTSNVCLPTLLPAKPRNRPNRSLLERLFSSTDSQLLQLLSSLSSPTPIHLLRQVSAGQRRTEPLGVMWYPELRSPTSLRLSVATNGDNWARISPSTPSPFVVFSKPHDSHPPLDHLIVLVFGAVLEVVCVSLPGYIIARLGHFDADKQKFLANLNVMLFTPCLSKSLLLWL